MTSIQDDTAKRGSQDSHDWGEHEKTCACRTMAPPSSIAMSLDEKRCATIRRCADEHLEVFVPTIGTRPMLIVVLATVVTVWALSRFTMEWFLLGVPSFFIWRLVLPRFIPPRKRFLVDPRKTGACHMPRDFTICLELPNGRWVGLRPSPPNEEGSEALAAWVRDLYGKKMYEI